MQLFLINWIFFFSFFKFKDFVNSPSNHTVHSSNENLFEDQLSSSPTPSNEEIKLHGNDEYPVIGNCLNGQDANSRACIMRTLSIVSNYIVIKRK